MNQLLVVPEPRRPVILALAALPDQVWEMVLLAASGVNRAAMMVTDDNAPLQALDEAIDAVLKPPAVKP